MIAKFISHGQIIRRYSAHLLHLHQQVNSCTPLISSDSSAAVSFLYGDVGSAQYKMTEHGVPAHEPADAFEQTHKTYTAQCSQQCLWILQSKKRQTHKVQCVPCGSMMNISVFDKGFFHH